MKLFSPTLFGSKATVLFITAIALSLAAPSLKAQVIYATNIGETLGNSAHLSNSPEWLGSKFTTDSSALSFTFNSVTVKFSSFTSAPTSFAVALFSDSSGKPGTALGSLLSGSAPSGNGNYTYTSSGISLAADTPYWVVIESSGGNYYQNMTASSTVTGGWSIANGNIYSSNSGSTWGTVAATGYKSQLEITASAIPEPSTYAAFAGAAMLGFVVWRRRKASTVKSAA